MYFDVSFMVWELRHLARHPAPSTRHRQTASFSDGKIEGTHVLRSIPFLDAAAVEAVRQWEYTPTLLNGSPVSLLMTVIVTFTLTS